MTPKSCQKSKIGGHFGKMCTCDPMSPSSATPGIGSISLYFPDCMFGEDSSRLQFGARLDTDHTGLVSEQFYVRVCC